MPAEAPPDSSCTLCDLPLGEAPVEGEAGRFCCAGCREIHRTLGDLETEEARRLRDRVRRNGTPEPVPDAAANAFLPVHGMHCAACEAFLETVAEQHPGVYRAEASAASERIRLQHAPDGPSREALAAHLSRSGYTAEADPEAGATAAREAEQNTAARLLLGGFFGLMVMMWYVIFLYPVYLGYEGLIDLASDTGRYALGNVWVASTFVVGYTGWPLFRGAAVSLRVLQPTMDLLVALAAGSAYLYSTGAILRGQTDVYFDVAVVIVFVVMLGRWVEGRVRREATGRLADLTREQVDAAERLGPDGTAETVDVDALEPGDRVRVTAGSRVPVDGTVAAGSAPVNEALVSGEAVPVEKTPGDAVIGGSTVQGNALTVTVGADAASTLDRLVELTWNVQASTPHVQQVADRIAAGFVPGVLLLAGAVGVGLTLTGTSPVTAGMTALTVLIVSCPCALGLATPLATAAGTRAALDEQIVMKHGGVIEDAPDVHTVVFDKTGTLTTGQMRVVEAAGPESLRRRARAAEAWTDHPVADAVAGSGPAADGPVTDVTTDRRGVAATVAGHRIRVGHPAYAAPNGAAGPGKDAGIDAARREGHVPVRVVDRDTGETALFVVGDRIRDEADAVLDRLSAQGLRLVVCTGDHDAAAAPLRADPRMDAVYAEVRPEAKKALLQRLQAEGPVAMVGDGSNDAPALAQAAVGVAFGPTALAAESADVVVLRDDLTGVPRGLALAATTRRRVRQNLGWAFAYNAVAIPLAVTGLLTPLTAALAMTASSLLVVANSAR